MGYQPIQMVHSNGNAPDLLEFDEAAGQTFPAGSPLRLVNGNATLCDTSNPWAAADIVIGIAETPGQNLAVAGQAEGGISVGTGIYQTGGKIIPSGAPQKTGKVTVNPVAGGRLFRIGLLAGQTFSKSLIQSNTYYALRFDATTKFWFCDPTDTSGNNNVLRIVGVDTNDPTVVHVQFRASQALGSN